MIFLIFLLYTKTFELQSLFYKCLVLNKCIIFLTGPFIKHVTKSGDNLNKTDKQRFLLNLQIPRRSSIDLLLNLQLNKVFILLYLYLVLNFRKIDPNDEYYKRSCRLLQSVINNSIK